RHRAYLDRDGHPLGPLPSFAQDRETMRALYRAIILMRTLDARAVALQRTGQLGTYPSALGQEAIGAAIGSAMAAKDVFLGTYREQGVLVWRGVKLVEVLRIWGGDERGNL